MLADATRIKLLWLLLHGESSVNDLAAASGKAQTGVSQHLAKLRMARLVQTRRQGSQIFYRIESDHVRALIQDSIHHAEHASAGLPDHHRNGATANVGGSNVTPLAAPDADPTAAAASARRTRR